MSNSRRLVSPMILLICIALGVEVRLALAPGQQDILTRLYTEARQAQLAGDYKTATQKYERIVSLRPEMAEAHANLGVLYYQQGQVEQATKTFKKAIQLKPDLAAPYLFLGLLAFNARQYEEALKYLKKANTLDPSVQLVQLYLGYTHYARSNYLEATRHLEKAAALEGNDPDAFYHLSKAYGHLSKQFFALLQKTFRDSIYTDLARAHFYEAEQNWEAAKEEYSRALEKHPESERLRQRLHWVTQKASGIGVSYLETSPEDDAIDGSIRFLHNPPIGRKIKEEFQRHQNRVQTPSLQKADSPEKLYGLAEHYQVLSYLASLWVLETAPNSYRAHQLKGQYYEVLDKDKEAILEYQRALQLKPELQNVHFSIGNLHWRRGKSEEALPELQQELKINPNHPEALYEIGDILYTQNRLEDAKEYYLRALRFEPGMAEAHLALEKIYSANGQYDRALEHLRKVLEISPEDATPHYRIATIYQKLGRSQEAQKEMEIFQQLKAREGKR